MDEIIKTIEKIIALMGLPNPKVKADDAYKKISIFIDDEIIQSQLDVLLPAFDYLINLIIKKAGLPPRIIDLNYYRKERERLIAELTRAAAHKAAIKKETVELPPMNSYERRIVHMEISIHPELKTESRGEGRDRRVAIKLLEENEKKITAEEEVRKDFDSDSEPDSTPKPETETPNPANQVDNGTAIQPKPETEEEKPANPKE